MTYTINSKYNFRLTVTQEMYHVLFTYSREYLIPMDVLVQVNSSLFHRLLEGYETVKVGDYFWKLPVKYYVALDYFAKTEGYTHISDYCTKNHTYW